MSKENQRERLEKYYGRVIDREVVGIVLDECEDFSVAVRLLDEMMPKERVVDGLRSKERVVVDAVLDYDDVLVSQMKGVVPSADESLIRELLSLTGFDVDQTIMSLMSIYGEMGVNVPRVYGQHNGQHYGNQGYHGYGERMGYEQETMYLYTEASAPPLEEMYLGGRKAYQNDRSDVVSSKELMPKYVVVDEPDFETRSTYFCDEVDDDNIVYVGESDFFDQLDKEEYDFNYNYFRDSSDDEVNEDDMFDDSSGSGDIVEDQSPLDFLITLFPDFSQTTLKYYLQETENDIEGVIDILLQDPHEHVDNLPEERIENFYPDKDAQFKRNLLTIVEMFPDHAIDKLALDLEKQNGDLTETINLLLNPTRNTNKYPGRYRSRKKRQPKMVPVESLPVISGNVWNDTSGFLHDMRYQKLVKKFSDRPTSTIMKAWIDSGHDSNKCEEILIKSNRNKVPSQKIIKPGETYYNDAPQPTTKNINPKKSAPSTNKNEMLSSSEYLQRVISLCNERNETLRDAARAFNTRNGRNAKKYSQQGNSMVGQIDKNVRNAAEAFYREALAGDKFRIDLHGLHVREARSLVDLVYRKCSQRNTGISSITIITGAGNHSIKGRAVLKPVIHSYLSSQKCKLDFPSNGSIKCTFTT